MLRANCNRKKTSRYSDRDTPEIPDIHEAIIYRKEKHTIVRITSHPLVGPMIHYRCKDGLGVCMLSHWWDKLEEEREKIGTIDE